MLPCKVTFRMPKIRRGNYIFLAWIGDHSPRHVHVYVKGKEVVRWDLENGLAMRGTATRRIREIIEDLMEEGLL